MHILAITADWHVNDDTALSPLIFRKQKDSNIRVGKLQRAIYGAWVSYWELVSSIKSELDAQVIHLMLGDLGDTNYHSDVELHSQYEPDIHNAMLDVTELPRSIADTNIVVRGTRAHTGDCGKLEESFAHDISAEPSPEGTASWWVFRAEIGGVRIHATHHPPTKTKMPNKRSQAVSRMCEYLASEYNVYNFSRIPHLAFWAHVHWSHVGHEMSIEGWTIPPWKGLGAFGHRIGVSLPNPVGGLIVTLPGDGTWKVNQFIRHPPRLPLWKPS